MSNPFYYGSPVATTQFLNRRKVLQRVVSRLRSQGQSTAIVGEPRMGKTSLLDYLKDPANQDGLYGDEGQRFIFSFIDIQMLGGEFSQAEFWEKVLSPLQEQLLVSAADDDPLAQHYRICQENNFGTFTLERFFKQLGQDQWRLVLLLDEFDLLLHHPTLNSAEFFGGLRALTSRSRGALAVVTASRQSLTTLNAETQALNPTGSPYFNIFTEVNLGPFPNKDIAALLNQAGHGTFSAADRRYIEAVAGGHPYLLQLVAAAVFDERHSGEQDAKRQHLAAGQRVYQETKFHFQNTWDIWSGETRKAITTVALAQIPHLLKHHDFRAKKFIQELPDFSPEIHTLKTIGWLEEEADIPGGYAVTQGAMLWWLSDELLRTIRSDTPFEEWLRNQEVIVGPFTRQQVDAMTEAAQYIGGLLHQGATTLIEAFAEGAGRAILG